MAAVQHAKKNTVVWVRSIDVEGVGRRWRIQHGESVVEVVDVNHALDLAKGLWPGSIIKVEAAPDSE